MPRHSALNATLAAFAMLAAVPPAGAADYGAPASQAAVEEHSSIPACDDAAVIRNIVERQAWAERNTWQDGVVIQDVVDMRQAYPGTRFYSMIEHRHCRARAVLSGAADDNLYYVISARQGFASIGWYVEFCMPRHDPWRVYDADCRVLK